MIIVALEINLHYLYKVGLLLLILSCIPLHDAKSNSDKLEDVSEGSISKDSLSFQLDNLISLFNTAKLDCAYTLSNRVVKYAKEYEDIPTKVHAEYIKSKVYNRRNEFLRSDSLVQEALKSSTDGDISFSLLILSYNNNIRQGNTKKAKAILNEAKEYTREEENNIFRYRYCLADYYTYIGDDNKALEELLIAKRSTPENVSPRELFNFNYQLAALYQSIGVMDQSILVGKENRKLTKLHDLPYYELFSIYTLLEAYCSLSNHEKVSELVADAIELKETYNLAPAFGYVYYVKAKSYLKQEKLDSALHYFDLGEEISQKTNSKKELCENLIGKSQVYLKKGMFDEAAKYAEMARNMDDQNNELLVRVLMELDVVNGNYTAAYKKSTQLSNRLLAESENKKQYEIISTLLTNKFNQEKEIQANALREKDTKNRRNLLGGILAGLIFLLLVFLFFLSRNQKKLQSLNESLTLRNDALTNFSYISSHDLKEPVRNIISFSELLENSLQTNSGNEKELEFTAIIKNSSKTLFEIVKSLKVFSETAFDEDVKLEEFDVREVFEDLSSNIQQLIAEKNAVLKFDNPEQVSTIKFCRPMLYLILQNLVQNAIKYNSTRSPIVEVSIQHDEDNFLVKVKDNGDGISPSHLEYIFKPFKTLNSKSITNSSGLGLSICKNILNKYGGKIWVQSKLDEGSTFFCHLPKNIINA